MPFGHRTRTGRILRTAGALLAGAVIAGTGAVSALAHSPSPAPTATAATAGKTAPGPTAAPGRRSEAGTTPSPSLTRAVGKVRPTRTSTPGPNPTRPRKAAPKATPTPVAPLPANPAKWTRAQVEQFWTPARMAAATDAMAVADTPKSAVREGMLRSQIAAGPAGEHFGGVATIGVLFGINTDLSLHACTASAVDSPAGNLIVTAGHCNPRAGSAFVPQYTKGKAPAAQPYGMWPIERGFVDARRTSEGPNSDLDFAFARVQPNARGQQLKTAVGGANILKRATSYTQKVTIIGYPKKQYDANDTAIRCSPITSQLPGYDQMQMTCDGYFGGVSGSAWMTDFNGRTGNIIGILGGLGEGGPNDHLSYAVMAHDEMFELYDDAVANRDPVRSAYRQPSLPFSLGSGDTWTHAKLLASGEYTGDPYSDLIVVWTDGEVTLYTGNGANGFSRETRLRAANAEWKDAVTMTGGDFSAGARSDLLVRWAGGEVTLYSDVTPAGMGAQTQLAAMGSVWKYADQIIGGRFGTAGLTTDLVVRWSDGETTLYTDTSTAGFGTEHQLRAPSDAWRNATLLTAGDFTGNDNWDVTIRWSDGRLDLYRDISPAGIGTQKQIAPANELWTHDLAMTAGSYNTNGHPDDLIVRWSDGETTLYADTGDNLGTEYQLVAPKA